MHALESIIGRKYEIQSNKLKGYSLIENQYNHQIKLILLNK